MSRGEELRAKFKAKGEDIVKELESPFGQFRSRLQSFVSEVCDASIEDGFARCIYKRWNASETDSFDIWLFDEVKPLFKSAGSAPRWRLEPSWLYHGDKPMTFVTQYDHDQHTFYVFEGRKDVEGGWIRIFRLSAQDEEGIVLLDGEITT